jgi:GNAT superfamily N-acetyltransferase
MTPVVSVCLLADRPELIEPAARIRWREWGHAPEPEDPAFWVEVTRQEAGRGRLPFTLVAVDATGGAVGVVGLGEFDQEDLRDRSPWVLGMVVDPAWRGQRVGETLLSELEGHAAELGYRQLWVATRNAAGFYARRGWQHLGSVDVAGEGPMVILTTVLQGGSRELLFR